MSRITGEMGTPSTFSIVLFFVIVAVVAFLFTKAAARATGRNGAAGPNRRAWIASALVFLGWLVVPAVLALRGALDRWSPMPAPPVVMMGVLTLGTIGLALSPFGARVAERFSLAALVGYQFFRVPVEWLLHRLMHEGFVPIQMTFAGRNFDIVSGILAALVAMYRLGGGRARGAVLLWNLIGLALLLNIGTIAVLSTPAIHAFPNPPANVLPAVFPWVWLPSFLVQAALFGHLVVFRALARKDDVAA